MEMSNLHPDAPKKIKMSLADLPPGTKAGDSVSLKIDSINQATGVAYVSHAADTEVETPADAVEPPAEEESGDESEESSEGKDTSVLLGPMNGLKNYLVQKSMDVPKNQGRS